MTFQVRCNKIGALTILILASLIFYTVNCFAQVGRTGVPFLLIAPDARGYSLAQGGSVYSTGAKSAYYNPANLTSSGVVAVDGNYTNYRPELVDGISYKNFYVSSNLGDWGYYGIGYNYFDLGKQSRYSDGGYEIFNTYESALTLYSAFDFEPNGSIGVGIKYINSHLSDAGAGRERGSGNDRSFAIDFGAQFRNKFPNATLIRDEEIFSNINASTGAKGGFAFGLSFLNLGPGINYMDADQKDPLPRRLLAAAGYKLMATKESEVNLTLDASHLLLDLNQGFNTEWEEFTWSYGVEANLYDMVAVRMGILNDRIGRQRYLTWGLGVGPEWLHADFSYVPDSDEEWNRHGGEWSLGLAVNLDKLSIGRF